MIVVGRAKTQTGLRGAERETVLWRGGGVDVHSPLAGSLYTTIFFFLSLSLSAA
jgi:hypothetical protein